MQTYTHYKDSGIDWIGPIPEHWEVKKITHLFSKVGSGTTPTAGLAQYYENGSINFLQTGDLNDNLITNTSKKITENALKDCSSLKIYPKGSLVIAMYGATIGKLGILDIETTTNQACCVLGDNKSNVEIKYIFYWFSFAKKQIISMSYGGGQPNISQDLIKSLRLNFPPIHEQEAIANFLDDKTAKIDALVQTKEQQIEKLKELRQAKIHQAVTKGLDANAPTKDSGVAWIGEIPAHWEVSELKRFCNKITDGSHSSPETQFEGKNYVSVKDVNEFGYIDLINCKKISEIDYILLEKNGCKPLKKDVLLTKDGTIGRAAVVEDDNDFVILSSLGLIRPNLSFINSYFLRYFLISPMAISNMYSLIAGSALTRLTIEKINRLLLVLPPIQEQEQIVAYLDEVTGKIDQAIAQKQEQISKLKEYKQSLINDVVTGKVKVCG